MYIPKLLQKASFILLSLLNLIAAANPVARLEVIKQETDQLVLDIKYPQGFTNPFINTTIKNFIIEQQQAAEKMAKEDKLSSDVSGKNGLYINYEIMFVHPKVLSVLFSVSTNTHGAAHPNNNVVSFNFIQDTLMSLPQVLKDTGALAKIASYCQQELLKNKQFDAHWVVEGTKPTLDNYKNWYITDKGIVMVFDSYQVAAYVYGPQKVLLPQAFMRPLMRTEAIKAVWGYS